MIPLMMVLLFREAVGLDDGSFDMMMDVPVTLLAKTLGIGAAVFHAS